MSRLREKVLLRRLIRQVAAAGKATPGNASALSGLDVTAFASATDLSALSTRLTTDEATLAGLPGTVDAGTLQTHPASDFATPSSVAAKPDLSSAAPQPVGTAAAGAGTTASRADHVHAHGNQGGGSLHSAATYSTSGFLSATDKSKLDGIASGAAALSSGAPPNVGPSSAAGIATTASHSDHAHGFDDAAHGSRGGGSLHPVAVASGANGFLSGTDKAKLDSVAASAAAVGSAAPSNVGAASAAGASASASRSDHVHGFDDTSHGSRGGGSLHAAATAALAGFLSAADKSKLDGITGTLVAAGSYGTLNNGNAVYYLPDLNNPIDGWAAFDGSSLNSPQPGTSGIVFTWSDHGNGITPAVGTNVYQLSYSTGNSTCTRNNLGGGGWSPWRKLMTTDPTTGNSDLLGAIVAASFDQRGASPLPLGATNATEVQLGKSSAPAKVYGKQSGAMSSLETVSASYGVTYQQNQPVATFTRIDFNTKNWDTHNAVTTGAGAWKFTAPLAGLYQFSGSLSIQLMSGTQTAGEVAAELVGPTILRFLDSVVSSSNSPNGWAISTAMYLSAGSAVYIQFFVGGGGVWAPRWYSSVGPTHVNIVRVPGS